MIAGCLSESSSGARHLQNLRPPNKPQIQVQPLDITDPKSISRLSARVKEVLNNRTTGQESRSLYALVNNAGFMAFGEFEWLTGPILNRHVEVNLLGTMRVTHSLLPMLRKDSQQGLGSRIINVTSHCSLVALPGLSVYAATKAGLSFWTSALRIEQAQYNVKVVNFIPGSFVMQSGLLRRQKAFGAEMWEAMDEDQREFYGEYFLRYQDYIGSVSDLVPKDAVDVDPKIVLAFKEAILARSPKRRYIVEPLRYKVYHNLFALLPDGRLRDRLIKQFMAMPEYKAQRNDYKEM